MRTRMSGLGIRVQIAKIKKVDVPEQQFMWTTAEGLQIRLSDMATPHLLNAIAKVRRGEACGPNAQRAPSPVPLREWLVVRDRPFTITDENLILRTSDGEVMGRVSVTEPMGNSLEGWKFIIEHEKAIRDMIGARKKVHNVSNLWSSGMTDGPAVDIQRIRFAHDHYGEGKLKALELDDVDFSTIPRVKIYPYMILEAARRGFRVVS